MRSTTEETEPIFEANFEPVSYGFRPNRRAQDAIAEIHYYGTRGYRWVLDADIEACFDRIDHTALMDRVRLRVRDKRVLMLVKAFLKAGIFTELGEHQDTMTGTPQGGIVSPLLARMSLVPKEETERAEHRACEWGDRDYVAAEVGVWVAEFDNGGMWNGYSPGGKLAPDWDTFQEWATDTLRTLESDLTILDMDLSFLMTPVHGDARSIQVFIEPGRIHAVASQPHYMDREILGSLGWQTGNGDASFAVREAPSHEDVQYLADLITTTLRAYGLELNQIEYSTTCRYSDWVNLLGLGLGHL